MSELATLTAAPRADVLPGYEFSRFTFAMFGMVEEELARRHVRNASLGAVDAPADIQDKVLRLAVRDVLDGLFAHGTPAFDAHIKAKASFPMVLWICLRRRHPGMVPAEADALITPENEERLYWAVLECAGYRAPEPGKKKEVEATDPSPDSGPGFSPHSASSDSPPTTSGT